MIETDANKRTRPINSVKFIYSGIRKRSKSCNNIKPKTIKGGYVGFIATLYKKTPP